MFPDGSTRVERGDDGGDVRDGPRADREDVEDVEKRSPGNSCGNEGGEKKIGKRRRERRALTNVKK